MLIEEMYSLEGQFCSESGAVLVVTHRKHLGNEYLATQFCIRLKGTRSMT